MAMSTFMITVIVIAVTAAFRDDVTNNWTSFKKLYKKNYTNDIEDNFRKSIFLENQQAINQHNEKYDLGKHSYRVKINQFGDMRYDEYLYYVNGNTTGNDTLTLRRKVLGMPFVRNKKMEIEIPDAMDWRDKGAVTPVRDQGLSCGSCWAISAAGALEAQFFKKTGVLTALSVQELIDCSNDYGNLGCDGGSTVLAFQYVMDHHSLEPESNYSYRGQNNECRHSRNDDKDKEVKPSFAWINRTDEDLLKVAVGTVGPASAAIDASHDTFRFYSEGIYYQPACNSTALDHSVLIVGYGTDNSSTDPKNHDYWLIKNSFGETWGEAGYFKIPRNRQNHCGIASMAIYPIVDNISVREQK